MPAPYRVLLNDAIASGTVLPEDETILCLEMNREMNLAPGNRPSDCMESAIRAYVCHGRDYVYTLSRGNAV